MVIYTLPDLTLVRQLVEVDFEDGLLFWKPRTAGMFEQNGVRSAEGSCSAWNIRHAGKPALNRPSPYGYKCGMIAGREVFAHRILYGLYHDQTDFPGIDHINGKRTDNRIRNLRACPQLDNMRNAKTPKNNKSGHIGVSWDKQRGKWFSYIRHEGKMRSLGRFVDFEEAAAVRKAAETRYGYHENHGRIA